MSDEYSNVAGGKLKLKSNGCVELKKKSKKKKKDKDKLKEGVAHSIREEMGHTQNGSGSSQSSAAPTRTLTKAELAFKQQQEKTVSTSGHSFRELIQLLKA